MRKYIPPKKIPQGILQFCVRLRVHVIQHSTVKARALVGKLNISLTMITIKD